MMSDTTTVTSDELDELVRLVGKFNALKAVSAGGLSDDEIPDAFYVLLSDPLEELGAFNDRLWARRKSAIHAARRGGAADPSDHSEPDINSNEAHADVIEMVRSIFESGSPPAKQAVNTILRLFSGGAA